MIEKLLVPTAFDIRSKIINILIGFTVILVWCTLISHFIGYLSSSTIKSALFFTCVLAPLWEELAFRVIPITIANTLDTRLLVPVILLSSILFGWGHGQGSISLLLQGVMGVVFSILYIKNNYSYWSVVALHSMWNLFCFIL